MLTCTPSAILELKDKLAQRGHGAGFRISVTTHPFAAWAYSLEVCDTMSDADGVMDFAGLRIAVAKAQIANIQDTVVDYVSTPEHAGFAFSRTAEVPAGQ